MTRLYVGNLSYETTEDSLRAVFGEDGRSVSSVAIIMDRETGRSRGFAFVEMASPADAEAAISACDGRELDGRQLRVNEARERPQRGGGGGGARRPGGRSGVGGPAGGPGGGMGGESRDARDGRGGRGGRGGNRGGRGGGRGGRGGRGRDRDDDDF